MAEPEEDNFLDEMEAQLTQEDKDGIMPPDLESQTQEVMEQVMQAKKGDPSQFASYWEMDEQDVDEATDEQIQTRLKNRVYLKTGTLRALADDPRLKTLWAAENGKMDVLQELLTQQPDLVQCHDMDGYTPLHRAAYNAHLDVMKYLVSKGAIIEARTNDGWTPLHSAANWGHLQEASFLLSCGANINAQTAGLQTPCHLAAANAAESKDMFTLFLMHRDTDYGLVNKMGETARQIAERTSRYSYLFQIADDAVNKLS